MVPNHRLQEMIIVVDHNSNTTEDDPSLLLLALFDQENPVPYLDAKHLRVRLPFIRISMIQIDAIVETMLPRAPA